MHSIVGFLAQLDVKDKVPTKATMDHVSNTDTYKYLKFKIDA